MVEALVEKLHELLYTETVGWLHVYTHDLSPFLSLKVFLSMLALTASLGRRILETYVPRLRRTMSGFELRGTKLRVEIKGKLMKSHVSEHDFHSKRIN